MFTLTEADNYNDQGGAPEAAGRFRSRVSEGGWLVCHPESLGAEERRWIAAHEGVAPWRARACNLDIFRFNRESRAGWRALARRHPELFREVGLRHGILRLYTDPRHMARSARRHASVGSLRRRLSPDDIGVRYPALHAACRSGLVAGGLEVVGFTVNVHRFMARALSALEEAGGRLRWNTPVRRLLRSPGGAIDGLATDSGARRADHYLIAPGAYGAPLLDGTGASGLVHGVLGVWMSIPNLEPALARSLKIARLGHRAEDANVTVGRSPDGEPLLVYGSGYGYTGRWPTNIDEGELAGLFAAVEENVRAFFPAASAAAARSGLLQASRRWCVRPWTPSGLGVMEILPARRGLAVIVGGHNTGGFAQAPAVASATRAALEGRPHAMHELYHPGRSQPPDAPRAAAEPELVPAAP